MSAYDDHESYNNTDAAIKAGMAMAEINVVAISRPGSDASEAGDPLMAVVLPEGAKLETKDVEKYLQRPTRKRGIFAFEDAKSFVEFVNREKTPETIILSSRANTSFTAVFNGNEGQNSGRTEGDGLGRPGWGDYRATYACPHSPEWVIWKAANGKKMSQAEFALFMEDNFTDIAVPPAGFDPNYDRWPDGNQMLAVSRGLEAKKDVTFASALRLDNGQVQFRYDEEVSGNVQGGLIEVPQKFAVGIPVFAGTAPWAIPARLRYRIERGGLSMWFDFERLFKITERAFDEARDEIGKGTSVPILLGARQGS